MGLYINTNIGSLDAQNNLSSSQMSLQTSLQRLSSGLRINNAKDDAAGLAIATRMTSQINGLSQAAQNANDGISMSQTAEGGMTTIANNLQRMRSLSVQAANGSNSTSDRQSIQAEIAQLQTQINQVATQTQYNGTNLLDGSLSNAQFQIGSNANQTLNMSIGNLHASAIGSYGLSATGAAAGTNVGAMTLGTGTGTEAGAGTTASPYALATTNVNGGVGGTINISGNGTTGQITTNTNETADQIAAQLNANQSISSTGVTATAATTLTLQITGTGPVSLNLFSTSSLNPITTTPTLTGGTTTVISAANGTGTNDLAGLVNSINSQSGTSGITASFNQSQNTITLSNTTGQDISVENAASTVGTTTIATGQMDNTGTFVAGAVTSLAARQVQTFGGQVSFNSPTAYSLTTGSAQVTSAADTFGSTLSSVGSINVDTVGGANSAIKIIDAALLKVNNAEADMGAIQNRFTSVISNLSTSGQNLTSARSLIQDTNFATETANLTRSQILQQAGTAMLAQANSLPNGVMTLLK